MDSSRGGQSDNGNSSGDEILNSDIFQGSARSRQRSPFVITDQQRDDNTHYFDNCGIGGRHPDADILGDEGSPDNARRSQSLNARPTNRRRSRSRSRSGRRRSRSRNTHNESSDGFLGTGTSLSDGNGLSIWERIMDALFLDDTGSERSVFRMILSTFRGVAIVVVYLILVCIFLPRLVYWILWFLGIEF